MDRGKLVRYLLILLALVLVLLLNRRRNAIAATNTTTPATTGPGGSPEPPAEWRAQAQHPVFGPIVQRTIGETPMALQTGLLVNNQRQVFRINVIGADNDRGREFVRQYTSRVKVFLQQRWAPWPTSGDTEKGSLTHGERLQRAPALKPDPNAITIIFELLGVAPHDAGAITEATAGIEASALTTRALIGQLRERVQLESAVASISSVDRAVQIDYYVDPMLYNGAPPHDYTGSWARACESTVGFNNGNPITVSLTRDDGVNFGVGTIGINGVNNSSPSANPNPPRESSYTLRVQLAGGGNYGEYYAFGKWIHSWGWNEEWSDT